MNVNLIAILVFGLLGFTGTGCQSGTAAGKPLQIPSQPSLVTAATSATSGNAAAYYYFSSAQIKLKKGEIEEAQYLLEQAIQHDDDSSVLKLELADVYLMQQETGKALDLTGKILAADSNHAEALILAGRIYQQKNDFAQAKSCFERALDLVPSNPDIYVYLGQMYWDENDLPNAERIFERMAAEFPTSHAAHYFIGRIWAARGKTAEAESAFLRSIELAPTFVEPRYELIKIYQGQNRSAPMIEMYRAILTHDPSNFSAAMDLAVQYRQMGQPDRGLVILAQLGRFSRHEPGILSYLFETYMETKQYEQAEWVVGGMLAGEPESPDLNYLAGVVYDGLKRFPEALAHWERVAPDSRFYQNAVVHRALLLRDSGKLDRSIDVIRGALANDPKNPDYFLYLGTFYEELEQYEKALETLSQGLAVDQQNIRLHFRIGVIHDKAGRKQDAIAAMRTVLEIQPRHTEALNYLGYTFADLGIHLDEAEDLIQSALEIKPDDGYITDSLAWVYYKKGKYREALEWLTKAEALVPDDPVILEHLGDVHLKLDYRDKALKYYRRSLEIKDSEGREQLEEKIRSLHQAP